MTAIFSFKCKSCGKIHEGSPSFSYDSPVYYGQVPESERLQRTKLSSDFCIIDDEDLFVRVCLEIPIHGVADPFLWGIWITLSKKNFTRYFDTWDTPDESDNYFGWFSNRLPYYPNTINLKMNVHPRKGGMRPWIDLEPTDHPLSLDYHNGISIARAQEIAEYAQHER
jgi:hypothetical protein